MNKELQEAFTVLLFHIAHKQDITREGLMSDLKRCIAGENPINLLGPDAKLALGATMNECVTGVVTSKEVIK